MSRLLLIAGILLSVSCSEAPSGVITLVPSRVILFVPGRQIAQAGGVIAWPVRFEVMTSDSIPVGGVRVSLSIGAAGGSISDSVQTTDRDGVTPACGGRLARHSDRTR